MNLQSRLTGYRSARVLCTVAGVLLCLAQAGCGLGYHIASAIAGTEEWQVDDIDVSLISDIVVGDTTRSQIETMFGKPRATLENPDMDAYNTTYLYRIWRVVVKRGIILFSPFDIESKTLLAIVFDGDVVRFFEGPEPGAVELLNQVRQEVTDRTFDSG